MYTRWLKLMLLSSHWYNEDNNTLSHLFWSIPILQNKMYQVHRLISMTQNCCTNTNDLALLNTVGFFRAFDGSTLTTVALNSQHTEEAGSMGLKLWLQSNEAKASGLDAHSTDDFMVTCILFTSIWISQPRMVSTCVRIFWSPIACYAIDLLLPTLLPRCFSDQVRYTSLSLDFVNHQDT